MVEDKRLSVNHFSESMFTVQGHGVHSAFVDIVDALRARSDLDVLSNRLGRRDITHLHTVGPMSMLMLALSKRSVVTAHITPASITGSIVGGKLFEPFWRWYLAWFYNRADVVLALNSSQATELRHTGVISDVVTIRPGTLAPELPSRAKARALLGIENDHPVVLSVGQIQPRKAVADFHNIASALPDVKFIWVGGFPFGPLTANYRQMRRLLRRCPVNVMHTGQLPRRDVRLYYAAADVYMHPSYQEHAPVAIFEAAAAGLPLVLRDIESYRMLYPGRYLAATDASFSGHVEHLFADTDLYRAMADHAAALSEQYAVRHSVADLVAIYRQLAKQSA